MSDPDLSYIHESLQHIAVPIADLTPDPKNARKHDRRNLDAIKASLNRFGMRAPIVVQRSGDAMIVRAGNGRMTAALELGWSHLPATVFDEDDNEAVAFAIADNRTAELAEWDFDVLADAIENLESFDDADILSAIGFSDKELSFLTTGANSSPIDKTATIEGAAKATTREIDLDEFNDDAFAHTCPRCKFNFND